MKKRWRYVALALILLAVLAILAVLGINGYVLVQTEEKILSAEQAAELKDVDCILVLGCLVREDGSLSAMLHDRLRRGVELYEAGAAPKLLMSGDHGTEDYDEVNAMKCFATDAGVFSSDVFMDHAGFSTYESMIRAKTIFGAKKIIIVTQRYHLYRALYIAEKLGLEAYGVSADYRNYAGQGVREIREILARNKDFFTSLLQPAPTYGGESIPISGDGDVTNDF